MAGRSVWDEMDELDGSRPPPSAPSSIAPPAATGDAVLDEMNRLEYGAAFPQDDDTTRKARADALNAAGRSTLRAHAALLEGKGLSPERAETRAQALYAPAPPPAVPREQRPSLLLEGLNPGATVGRAALGIKEWVDEESDPLSTEAAAKGLVKTGVPLAGIIGAAEGVKRFFPHPAVRIGTEAALLGAMGAGGAAEGYRGAREAGASKLGAVPAATAGFVKGAVYDPLKRTADTYAEAVAAAVAAMERPTPEGLPPPRPLEEALTVWQRRNAESGGLETAEALMAGVFPADIALRAAKFAASRRQPPPGGGDGGAPAPPPPEPPTAPAAPSPPTGGVTQALRPEFRAPPEAADVAPFVPRRRANLLGSAPTRGVVARRAAQRERNIADEVDNLRREMSGGVPAEAPLVAPPAEVTQPRIAVPIPRTRRAKAPATATKPPRAAPPTAADLNAQRTAELARLQEAKARAASSPEPVTPPPAPEAPLPPAPQAPANAPVKTPRAERPRAPVAAEPSVPGEIPAPAPAAPPSPRSAEVPRPPEAPPAEQVRPEAEAKPLPAASAATPPPAAEAARPSGSFVPGDRVKYREGAGMGADLGRVVAVSGDYAIVRGNLPSSKKRTVPLADIEHVRAGPGKAPLPGERPPPPFRPAEPSPAAAPPSAEAPAPRPRLTGGKAARDVKPTPTEDYPPDPADADLRSGYLLDDGTVAVALRAEAGHGTGLDIDPEMGGRILEATADPKFGLERKVVVDVRTGKVAALADLEAHPGDYRAAFAASQRQVEVPAEMWQPRPPRPATTGRATKVMPEDGSTPIEAEYAVVEAADIAPSNRPDAGFSVNPEYPPSLRNKAGQEVRVQEKPIHGATVTDIVGKFSPDRMISDAVGLDNAPPVVTPAGYVLAGNHRIIALTKLLADGGMADPRLAAYRKALLDRAAQFGLDAEAVAGMKAPVLVRRLKAEPGTLEATAAAAKPLNAPASDVLRGAEAGASAGRIMRTQPDLLTMLADAANDYGGVLTALNRDKAFARETFQKMLEAKVVTDRQKAAFFDEGASEWTPEGKLFMQRALIGAVFEDPALIMRSPPSVINKVESAAPAILRTRVSPESDIAPDIQKAFEIINKAEALKEAELAAGKAATLEGVVNRLTRTKDMFGANAATVENEIAELLANKTVTGKLLRRALELYAERSKESKQPGMFSKKFGKAEALRDALQVARKQAVDGNLDLHSGIPLGPALEKAGKALKQSRAGSAVRAFFRASSTLRDAKDLRTLAKKLKDPATKAEVEARVKEMEKAADLYDEFSTEVATAKSNALDSWFRAASGHNDLPANVREMWYERMNAIRDMTPQQAAAELSLLRQDPAFDRYYKAFRQVADALWDVKKRIKTKQKAYWVPRRILTGASSSSGLFSQGGGPVPPPLPGARGGGSLPGGARVTQPSFHHASTGKAGRHLPDLAAQLAEDARQTYLTAGRDLFIKQALKTGRLMMPQDNARTALGLVEHVLSAPEIESAARMGVVPSNTPTDRTLRWEVPRAIENALRTWHAGKTPAESEIGPIVQSINALSRASVGLDPGGMGLPLQSVATRVPLTDNRYTNAALVARAYMKAVLATGKRIPPGLKRLGRMSDAELNALIEAHRRGIDVSAETPAELTGFKFADAYFDIGNRILWMPEGWKQQVVASYWNVHTRAPTLMDRLALRKKFDPDNPADLARMRTEIEGIVGGSLTSMRPGAQMALRAMVPYAGYRKAGWRLAYDTMKDPRRAVSFLVTTAVTLEALNYAVTSFSDKGGHFTWDNDPGNEFGVELPWQMQNGRHYAVNLSGMVGAILRVTGAKDIAQRVMQSGQPPTAEDWSRMLNPAHLSRDGPAARLLAEAAYSLHVYLEWVGTVARGGKDEFGRQVWNPDEGPVEFAKDVGQKVAADVAWPTEPWMQRIPAETPQGRILRGFWSWLGGPALRMSAGSPVGREDWRNEALRTHLRDEFYKGDAPLYNVNDIMLERGMRPFGIEAVKGQIMREKLPPEVRDVPKIKRTPSLINWWGDGAETPGGTAPQRTAPRPPARTRPPTWRP